MEKNNTNLSSLYGKKTTYSLVSVFGGFIPFDRKNENTSELIEKHDKTLSNYNHDINKIVAIQNTLDKSSKEYNDLDREKTKLFYDRGKALMNVVIYNNQIVGYFNVDGFNAYLDKDNRYLITIVKDGKEIPFGRILPRLWLERSPKFYETLVILFLEASKKRNNNTFTLTYEDLKKYTNLKDFDFTNYLKSFKLALDQLSDTRFIDKYESAFIIVSSLKEKGKGWTITFNNDLYNLILNEGYGNMISEHLFKLGLSDRQVKLYISITQYIYTNRNKENFTYRFTRNMLLKMGGYKADSDFKDYTKEKAKNLKNKEHTKLMKDLELLVSHYNEIKGFKNKDKILSQSLLLISKNDIKTENFTIMDFFTADLDNLERQFTEHCKTNKTALY